MKRIFILLLVVFVSSCSKNDLIIPNREMLWVQLDKPGVYNWTDESDPSEAWQEYQCGNGPYDVRIEGNMIIVDTYKNISWVKHLTGKYRREAVDIGIIEGTKFKVKVDTPDKFGQVIRIAFEPEIVE